MKKTYVLDTNVVLQNPNALKTFEEHDVIVPLTVIRELDQMKKGTSSVSCNARAALRVLASLIEQHGVNRSVSVPLPVAASSALILVRLVMIHRFLPTTRLLR